MSATIGILYPEQRINAEVLYIILLSTYIPHRNIRGANVDRMFDLTTYIYCNVPYNRI